MIAYQEDFYRKSVTENDIEYHEHIVFLSNFKYPLLKIDKVPLFCLTLLYNFVKYIYYFNN